MSVSWGIMNSVRESMNFGALEMGHRKSRRNVSSVRISHVASRDVTQQRWHPAYELLVCLTRTVGEPHVPHTDSR
jgi:hypothetical protein